MYDKFAKILSRQHKQTTFSNAGCLVILRVKVNEYTFRGDNSESCFSSLLKRGLTQKGKNLFPFWNKFSPFRIDPFQKGFDV